MNTSQVLLDEIIILDEPGFACSKSKLVENGLIHLRPFNVSNNGTVCFDEVYLIKSIAFHGIPLCCSEWQAPIPYYSSIHAIYLYFSIVVISIG